QLIARLIAFQAFAVYLLDERHHDLRIAYSVGYPERETGARRLKVGEELVVPLRRKGRVIGALNLLSPTVGQFTETDEAILRQFGAHVAVALENAKLFEAQR